MIKFHKAYRNAWSNSNFAYKFKNKTKYPQFYSIDEITHEIESPTLLLDRFLDSIQDATYLPLDCIHSIRIYINNRFYTKTNLLMSNLEVGVWHEYSERIASVLSDSFLHWMETEYCSCDKFDADKFINHHLWEVSLILDEYVGIEIDNPIYGTPTRQNIMAKTLFEIYQYFKYQRPNIESYDVYTELDTKYLTMIINHRNSMWT